MTSVDLFLIDGSYRAEGDGVVLELFGRNRDGEAMIARYSGFQPYFDLVEPKAPALERLKGEAEVVKTEPVKLWLEGADRDALRVTIRSPWKVPEFRDRYREPGNRPNVIACDIPFVHRFLYDKHVGLTFRFEADPEPEEVRRLYLIPNVVRVRTDPGADIRAVEPFRPSLRLLSFDIENAIRERTIFTICGVASGGGKPRETFRFGEPDERAILEKFAQFVEKDDPDVITGYNIAGYDLPLLYERAEALGVVLTLGRDRSALRRPRNLGDRIWQIPGRVVADAWWWARRELRPKQETLQFVARTLLNDSKLDVDRRNISEEWAKNPGRVMEYCEHDADLALRILEKLRTVDRGADLATVANLPLEEGINGRTSQFIDALLIPYADERHVGVPPTHRLSSETAIEGGYVHSIRPGVYPWVVVLDFKSMYPSIIISRNICFTTLAEDGSTVSPNGVHFVTPDVRRGLIPEILRQLLTDRDRFRGLARSEPTAEARAYYDGLQNAVKVLMNSFYGVLASSFYRFTNKSIGAAITAFAREQITSIIGALEKDGYEVVYSDTDSVFVRSPTPTLEGAKQFGEAVAARFTRAEVTFEFQSIYEAFFSHGVKKRYVGRQRWPREELVVRGYETRRSDSFEYQSKALLEIFDLVLKGDTERVLKRSRELVLAVRQQKVEPSELVVARSVRSEDEYNESTRDALPFLRVFRRLRDEGYDVIPGMKVAWIVTNARASPQEIEPWIEGRPFTAQPDWSYYAERVAQTLARVTEVFGWDANALLLGSQQRRLAEPPPEPPPSGPPTTLDTPLTEALGGGRKRRVVSRALDDFSS